MKRIFTIVFTSMLIFSMCTPILATQEEKEIDVTIHYVSEMEGEYKAPVTNGTAIVDAGGVSIYEIYFLDKNQTRLSAEDVNVVMDCPVSEGEVSVCSITTKGEINELSVVFTDNVNSNNASKENTDKNQSNSNENSSIQDNQNKKMRFTANGSHYYVLTEKQSVNEPDSGSDSEPSDKPDSEPSDKPNTPSEDVTSPPTGDMTQMWTWVMLILAGSICLELADVRKKQSAE